MIKIMGVMALNAVAPLIRDVLEKIDSISTIEPNFKVVAIIQDQVGNDI